MNSQFPISRSIFCQTQGDDGFGRYNSEQYSKKVDTYLTLEKG